MFESRCFKCENLFEFLVYHKNARNFLCNRLAFLISYFCLSNAIESMDYCYNNYAVLTIMNVWRFITCTRRTRNPVPVNEKMPFLNNLVIKILKFCIVIGNTSVFVICEILSYQEVDDNHITRFLFYIHQSR